MKIKFTIEGNFYKSNCLPSYNDYIDRCRFNKYAGNNFKQDFQKIISTFIPKHDIIKSDYKLNLVMGETSKRRDKDNIESFAKKLINDTLQEYGVVENDKLYAGGEVRFEYGEKAYIEVEILY